MCESPCVSAFNFSSSSYLVLLFPISLWPERGSPLLANLPKKGLYLAYFELGDSWGCDLFPILILIKIFKSSCLDVVDEIEGQMLCFFKDAPLFGLREHQFFLIIVFNCSSYYFIIIILSLLLYYLFMVFMVCYGFGPRCN